MANQPSESLAALEQAILDEPEAFEFFQAYRILNLVNDAYPVSARRPARKIHVRPELSMGYGNADISAIQLLENNQGYEITTLLSGLYGTSSPLPDFYNEELLDNEWEGHSAAREFLDIIHHQLFDKLYDAWTLHKLTINTYEKEQYDYWDMLFSLQGIVNQDHDPDIAKLKVRYFNLYANSSRSRHGLELLISDYWSLPGVQVEEYCMQTISIPVELRCQLGVRNHVMGEAHLGSHINDQNHAIRIHTPDLSESDYQSLRHDQARMERLKTLVKDYLKTNLSVEIVFHIQSRKPQIALGQQWHELGVTSYLSRETTDRTVVIPFIS